MALEITLTDMRVAVKPERSNPWGRVTAVFELTLENPPYKIVITLTYTIYGIQQMHIKYIDFATINLCNYYCKTLTFE